MTETWASWSYFIMERQRNHSRTEETRHTKHSARWRPASWSHGRAGAPSNYKSIKQEPLTAQRINSCHVKQPNKCQ